MKPWFVKAWNNKFIRDRFFAVSFLITMFVGFYFAYHGRNDAEKLWGLVPGMLSFMSIFTIVFDDFEKKGGWDNNKPDDDDDRSKR